MTDQTPTTPASTPARSTDTFAGVTRDQVRQFRQEHGEDFVKTLSIPLGGKVLQVIVRKPSRVEFERHTETLMKLRENKVQHALGANRTLVQACALAPDAATLKEALDTYPALADKLAEPVLAMAGADAEVREETF
jgi:hypothetical protein